MLLASGCWVSAYLMISSKNPVYSVFYLVLVFLHQSGLLCLIGLEYFQLLQLLVYVGQLQIMFLFVVMLLHIPATEILAHQRGAYPVAGVLLLCFVQALRLAYNQEARSGRAVLQYGNNDALPFPYGEALPRRGRARGTNRAVDWKALNMSTSSVAVLGSSLYSVHVDLLLLQSLLLLIAMVGQVQLTLKRRARAPVHDVFVQHSVDFQKVVYSAALGKAQPRSSTCVLLSKTPGTQERSSKALPLRGRAYYNLGIII